MTSFDRKTQASFVVKYLTREAYITNPRSGFISLKKALLLQCFFL